MHSGSASHKFRAMPSVYSVHIGPTNGKVVFTCAAAEIDIPKTHEPISFFRCVSRFCQVFQDTWHSSKGNPSDSWHATLSSPLLASNHANLNLALISISFWMLIIPWTFQEPKRLKEMLVVSYFALQACISFCTHYCCCLVRIKMPVAHMSRKANCPCLGVFISKPWTKGLHLLSPLSFKMLADCISQGLSFAHFTGRSPRTLRIDIRIANRTARFLQLGFLGLLDIFYDFRSFCGFGELLNLRTFHAKNKIVQARLLQKSDPRRILLVDFLGAFSLGNKIHPRIHSKIRIRIWELRGQNPHCKDLPLKTCQAKGRTRRDSFDSWLAACLGQHVRCALSEVPTSASSPRPSPSRP